MMNIKLLLGTLLMMLSSICFGQVIINQNFNASTSLPTGWTSNGSGTSTQACDGNSIRRNIYNATSNSTMTLTSPNQVGASNGNDIAVSVDYKVVNWSNETVATP
ncbi:MAG: hypothetical protein NWQ09_01230, partial [Nonlabens sp.]|nr:hypothetical protein [Nonlabens sp.]